MAGQASRSGTATAAADAGRVYRSEPGVLTFEFPTHVTVEVVKDFEAKYLALEPVPTEVAFFDVSRVTWFDPAVRSAGHSLLVAVRGRNHRKVVAFVKMTAVRMMGSAIAFAAGLPMVFTDSMASSMAALHGP